MNYLDKLKKDKSSDFIFKEIKISNDTLTIVTIDTISNNAFINDFILKKISFINNDNNLYSFLLNNLPCISVKEENNYEKIVNLLLNGYTLLFVDNNTLAIETINFPIRSVSESDYEKAITGPKDSFIENINTNIGLIRKRIKSMDLKVENLNIGKYTKTNIGIMYINTIAKLDVKDKIINKIKKNKYRWNNR